MGLFCTNAGAIDRGRKRSTGSSRHQKRGRSSGALSMTWDFGLDHDLVISDNFEINLLPSLVLLDREGNMIKFWEGVTDPAIVVDEINTNFDLDANYVPGDPSSQLFNQLLNNTPFRITVGLVAILFIYTVFIPKKKPVEEISEGESSN